MDDDVRDLELYDEAIAQARARGCTCDAPDAEGVFLADGEIVGIALCHGWRCPITLRAQAPWN